MPHALPMLGEDEAHTIDEVLQPVPFFNGLSVEERKKLALIDGKPRSTQITTQETCALFLLGRQEFLRLVSTSPHMLADLLVGMSGRIRER